MMGDRLVTQESLFYGFCLDEFVPSNHMLRVIDRFVDLSDLRRHLGPFYSSIGRPSIDPELMIRMLLVGYCDDSKFGEMRSQRIGEHRSFAHQQLSRFMKHQNSLLIGSLHGDEAHARPGNGLANRFGIRGVRLPALHIGLDVGWRHQLYAMSEY